MKLFKPPIERWELIPIDWSMREFIPGTLKTFGIRSVVTLMSPLLNTIINFRHRGKTLAFIDRETGKELHPLVSNALVCNLSRPNNPMQATGLRPSGADEQTLSSDSSSEGGVNNPPRA